MASTPHTPPTHTTAVSPEETKASHTSAPAALWAISLSIILGSLTNSIMMGSVNVALPTMMTSLRAEVTQIQWVLTSFMIARTVMMPTLGWIGGLLGNRQLYLTSLSVYVAASRLCGLAWNLESMIFFRVLQGIGAGYLFPLGMTILHEVYPAGKRGMALAGFFLEGHIAVRTTALAENQQLASVEHTELSSRLQERLQQAGEEPALLTAQTEAMFNRWLLQEATVTAYHDMFLRLAAMVLLTTLPILWVRQRRPS